MRDKGIILTTDAALALLVALAAITVSISLHQQTTSHPYQTARLQQEADQTLQTLTTSPVIDSLNTPLIAEKLRETRPPNTQSRLTLNHIKYLKGNKTLINTDTIGPQTPGDKTIIYTKTTVYIKEDTWTEAELILWRK